jgi:hypothetical protein
MANSDDGNSVERGLVPVGWYAVVDGAGTAYIYDEK